MSFLRGRSATRPWERGPSQTASTSQDIFDSIGPAPRDKDPFRWGGDLRMSSRTRNLLLAAAIPVVMVVVALTLLPSGSASVGESAGKAVAPSRASTVDPRGDESDMTSNDAVEQGRRAYAVALPELKGLPPEAIPGTRLELWVAWDPPVTKQPRVQKLIEDVILAEMIPPVVPEAPATAVLSVPTKTLPDLLYGDRYGALSATIVPGD